MTLYRTTQPCTIYVYIGYPLPWVGPFANEARRILPSLATQRKDTATCNSGGGRDAGQELTDRTIRFGYLIYLLMHGRVDQEDLHHLSEEGHPPAWAPGGAEAGG